MFFAGATIIDTNPRGNTTLKQELEAEEQHLDLINIEKPKGRRYKERSNVERVNGWLKDEFGGRMFVFVVTRKL